MLIEKYFAGRLKEISSADDRASFAVRELKTIEILAGIVQRNLLPSDGSVADIGCGDRFLQPEFEKRGMKYSGFDIEDGDFETDPIPADNNCFDLMVSYSLIEHLRDPSLMLSEMARCLKQGGHLLLETPNWHYSQQDFFNDYTHVKPYTPNSLKNLLVHQGFNVLGDFPNLRCKSRWAYNNKYRYALANLRPLAGTASTIFPPILKGRARGIFIVAAAQ